MFVLAAIIPVPSLVFGSFLATMGAWIGQERYWYSGPILLIVGVGLSIGAGLYAFSLGSIWGALLVASPAVCIALGFVARTGGPTIGVLFSPPAILLGLVIVLRTEHRRRVEADEDRNPPDLPRVWYPEPSPPRRAVPDVASLDGTPLTIETVSRGADDDPTSPHVMR